ncbi:GNAT family N-acetyltransferase [Herbaspirillum seropedicae]|uniref:GNAT family N-acetyltransferase n=1 Tax=Herbaspirillum seropedicae TaxID=964 RepID=UPI003F8D1B8F
MSELVFATQPTLQGRHVKLRPLAPDDAPFLLAAASDGELWNLKVTVVPGPNTVEGYLSAALQGRASGTMMPFAIVRQDSGAIVGSTRYWKIDGVNRKLEIGHTWLALSCQRTAINTESKYLLLRHAFETMGCVRVQFQTDELNERSRAAILRLGAVQEGILRNERIMPDGRRRNSVRFSITDEEWPNVKASLATKLDQFCRSVS